MYKTKQFISPKDKLKKGPSLPSRSFFFVKMALVYTYKTHKIKFCLSLGVIIVIVNGDVK